MAGLGGDPLERHAGQGGGGGVAGPQGVGGDPLGGQTGGDCAVVDHAGHGVAGEAVGVGVEAVGAGEERTRSPATQLEPTGQGGDGVAGGALAVGDGDGLAGRFGVGLGPADPHEQPGGVVGDVVEVETDELGAAQGAG